MNNWVFLLGYKLIWVVGLWGYSKQLDGLALVLALGYVSRAYFLFLNKARFVGYVCCVFVLGLFFETMVFEPWVYRLNMPNQGMPLFLVAIWLSFPVFCAVSLKPIIKKTHYAVFLGAVLAPIAYSGAVRFDGLESTGSPIGLWVLSGGFAFMMWVIAKWQPYLK